MIQVTDPSVCSGCTACKAICKQQAIKMVPDKLGFLYPIVNKELCIECGICDRICPFSNSYDKSLNLPEPISFAVRHKNISEVETSRSGAAFIALSDKILSLGGVVYGVGLTDNFDVVHCRAIDKKTRNTFKGSKYVQSDLNDIFYSVKRDLESGLKVLFSGTPCQTAGLKAFIGKRLSLNLYLVDIICHGVASPFVWKDYLDYLRHKENDNIISVNFRDKSIFGWSGLHKESFLFKNKGKKTYSYTFYDSCLLRRSCYKCVFTNVKRPSDITIGDLWGWEKVVPDFNKDDKGVSLVLCNTRKGVNLFDSIRSQIYLKEIPLESCMQHNLIYPTQMDIRRNSFENDYAYRGFNYVRNKYGCVGIRSYLSRILNFIKRLF